MKFLIDNALPPRLAALLIAAGYNSVHVRHYSMQAASDELILARALAEQRVLVSADTDFGTLLASQRAGQPSFILFRDPDVLTAEDYFNALLENLPLLRPELEAGCVAVFRSGRLRVRRLPISPA